MIHPQIFHHHPSIEAAVLFGSCARGDSDMYSDFDVALFVKAGNIETLTNIKKELVDGTSNGSFTFSLYSTRTAEILAQDGSLFLWHLNLEGKVLFERDLWISSLFARLKPYGKNKALRDLTTFERILNDVRDALRRAEATALFEAATMYSILRNSGMIYSYAKGAPRFGRSEPIVWLANLMGEQFPLLKSEISMLEALRLAYTRFPSIPVGDPKADWCLKISSKVAAVLEFVKASIHARES